MRPEEAIALSKPLTLPELEESTVLVAELEFALTRRVWSDEPPTQ